MIAGTIRNGNLVARCPFCGDSDDPRKGHFSVDLRRGLYQCFRCKESGKLTPQQSLDLQTLGIESFLQSSTIPVNWTALLAKITPGPGSSRPSSLPRYELQYQGETWDTFVMRDPYDQAPVGLHLRSGKQSLNLGEAGLAWPDDTSEPLVSTPSQPLRLVEGPYDVIEARDLCVFGLISSPCLKLLVGHHVLLCPDGDVWQRQELRDALFRAIRGLLHTNLVSLVGVELLPDGKDPDEVQPRDRIQMDRSALLHYLAKQEKRRYIHA